MLAEIFLELIIGEVVSGKTVEGVYRTEPSAPIPRVPAGNSNRSQSDGTWFVGSDAWIPAAVHLGPIWAKALEVEL